MRGLNVLRKMRRRGLPASRSEQPRQRPVLAHPMEALDGLCKYCCAAGERLKSEIAGRVVI